MARTTAVIDIGSNSARMAVFERTSRFGFHLIKEVKSRVRISEDSYENDGYLQPIPMERAYKAMRDFKQIAAGLKAKKILCVATSAMRDAPNSSELVNRISKELGINIKVIEGEKEAFYGAVAALNLLPGNEGFTIDIGGGSTECAHIVNGRIEELVSLNIGTIRIKELFFDQKRDLSEAKAFIQAELDQLPKAIKTRVAIGIGGTIRALSKAIMKNENYPIDAIHGYEYDVSDHRETFEKISHSSVMKLKKFGIKEDRYDTIREGALIFSMILDHINAEHVITSGAGVREGVFLSDLLRDCNHKFPVGFNPSVKSLADRYCHNHKCAEFHKKNVLKLFDVLQPLHEVDNHYKYQLRIAAKLSNIGVSLNYYGHHHHGSYLLLNSLNYGFSHKDRLLIALLVEYHDKKIPNNAAITPIKSLMPDLIVLQWLSFILSLAEALNANFTYPNLSFSYSDGALIIHSDNELYLAQEAIKKLSKPMPIAIQIKTPHDHCDH